MSMKNKDTWEFAHKYCGKVWYVCGMVMLPITVIFMLLVIGKNEDCVGEYGRNYLWCSTYSFNWVYSPNRNSIKKEF